MAAPGPLELGRGVVVLPGTPTPGPWTGCPRVVIDGQVINPGDILVADENGIAVVPSEQALAVLEQTKVQIGKEAAIREKIASGATVLDLLAEFGHL